MKKQQKKNLNIKLKNFSFGVVQLTSHWEQEEALYSRWLVERCLLCDLFTQGILVNISKTHQQNKIKKMLNFKY